MNVVRCILATLAITAVLPASALCLDPKTQISGYRIPLDEEVRSAALILTGRVVEVTALQEDPADPHGITAHLWKVAPLLSLKGHPPRTVILRVENDSGRYSLEVGEEHLLFIGHHGKELTVDGCGNSSTLPEGEALLAKVRRLLARPSSTR